MQVLLCACTLFEEVGQMMPQQDVLTSTVLRLFVLGIVAVTALRHAGVCFQLMDHRLLLERSATSFGCVKQKKYKYGYEMKKAMDVCCN